MPPARHQVHITASSFFAVATLVYTITGLHRAREADIYNAALAGWRIATGHTPWLDHLDISAIPHAFLFEIGTGAHGHLVVHRSPGVVLAAIPGYLISGGSAAISGFSMAPAMVTAALLTAASVTLLYLTVVRHTSQHVAAIGTATFAFATPIWTINGSGLWTHTLTVLSIIAMAWAADRERWLLVGILSTIAIWGRLHTALIVTVVGLGVALSRRQPAVAVRVGVPAVLGTAAAGIWSHWLYGSWIPSGGYNGAHYTSGVVHGFALEHVRSVVTNELGLWISPGRGILVWTPVLILLVAAVIRNWRDLPDWSRWLLLGGFVYTLAQGLINASSNSTYFTGGAHFYGYRLTLEFLACATPALVMSAHRLGNAARSLIGPVIGIQFVAMTIGARSGGAGLPMDRAWVDNTLWLAMQASGAVDVLLVFGAVIGALVARRIRNSASAEPARPSP